MQLTDANGRGMGAVSEGEAASSWCNKLWGGMALVEMGVGAGVGFTDLQKEQSKK